jgi:rubrerythrin
MNAPVSKELRDALEQARRAEKVQALTYRSLAARAESGDDGELAQRFHELHADEQHHLSRLTARVLELGWQPVDLADVVANQLSLEAWEGPVRAGENEEIERYSRLLAGELDPQTRSLIEQVLEVEKRHAAELGGKWTMA